MSTSPDYATAEAFAYSWNTLPVGSVYTREQVLDWIAPLTPAVLLDKRVLELGCGNGSILWHVAHEGVAEVVGVDLGGAVDSARRTMAQQHRAPFRIIRADLRGPHGEQGDVVLCIGVLHHLSDPQDGFRAVLEATVPGGLFHCWVYGWEGNAMVRWCVEPVRRFASRLWPWVTKYLIALPMAIPFYLYSQVIVGLGLVRLPLFQYMAWIAQRPFRFFWHVAFDQLVTPQTRYIRHSEIGQWFQDYAERIQPGSTYIVARNGHSWKFGGQRR